MFFLNKLFVGHAEKLATILMRFHLKNSYYKMQIEIFFIYLFVIYCI